MRPVIFHQPVSQAALWSLRLASFGAVVAGLAALLAHFRAIDPLAGLVVLAGAGLFALAAILLAAAAAVAVWRTGAQGTAMALAGLALSLLVLAYPAAFAVQAVRLPVLSDVTTDIADPPEFALSAKALAARGGKTPGDVSAATRQAQLRAYPAVQSKLVDAEGSEALQLVLKVIALRGWKVVEQTAPGGRSGLGHIDAVDRTRMMSFPDDIAIRLRPLPGQTRVDVRSVSRYGLHDFGTNARRIEAFMTELQAQADAR